MGTLLLSAAKLLPSSELTLLSNFSQSNQSSFFQFFYQICKIYADLYSEAHIKYSGGRSKIDINQILKDL